MSRKQRGGDTAHNTNTGSGHQNNNDAGTQNVAYNGGQVNNSFVNNYNATAPNRRDSFAYLSENRSELDPFAALKSLWGAVAGVGASHTAEQQFERGVCFEGTRIRVLKAVYDWLDSTSSENCSLPICWLSGPAGVGKSAIALTIAKACEEKGLAASFFFFRSDPRRNNPSALVLTIAQGLVVNTRFTGASINQRISDDPSILEARLEDQFRELLVKPSLRGRWWKRLLAKLSSAFKEPNLIIMDGLDECGDEPAQRRILSTILSSYQGPPRSPLRFLICSRPEAWIQETFQAEGLSRISECVVLDDKFEPDSDIERYYLHEFQLIREDRKYSRVQFPTPWPSSEDLGRLVLMSSAQFVYAVTTIRFIKLPHSNPISNLQIILNYTPEDCSSQSALATLDGLYRVVLSVNPNREKMLSILAAILIIPPHASPSPEFIELLLGLPAGDVDTTLWSLHSVLNIRGGDVAITVYHTSLTDFLHDPSRSREFHIDRAACYSALARQWLRNLTTNKVQTYKYEALYGSETISFFTNWLVFCTQLKPTRDLLEDLWHVDLASTYLLSDSDWESTFEGLVSWVRRYDGQYDPGISPNNASRDWREASGISTRVKRNGQPPYDNGQYNEEDDFGLMKDLLRKCRYRPNHFHLVWPPDVSPQSQILHWMVQKATYCDWKTRLDGSRPSNVDDIRLTDCRYDLSGGIEHDSVGHLAYQRACMQLVKNFTSTFESLAGDGAMDDEATLEELENIFLNVVQSLLLKHCCFPRELLSLCGRFFRLAEGCSVMRISIRDSMFGITNMFEWIETFPDEYAEEGGPLKAQVLAWPLHTWEQNWQKRIGRWKGAYGNEE
ncbi:hypothetical protein PQX77_005442 [Marasmius sp. AFHP31]|nr:hypothetical protein PQX77_005442 [Marasmius sp. AFHP31]